MSPFDTRRVALAGPLAATTSDGVVWNTRSGRYIELAPPAVELLQRVAACDGGATPAILRTASDGEILRDLAAAGLVTVWDDIDGVPARFLDVLLLAFLNLVVRGLLRLGGASLLRATVDVEPVADPPMERSWAGLRCEQLVAASRVASALPLVDGRCLPVALALKAVLRSTGIRSRLRLGATAKPLHAHAWLEVRGCRVDPTQGEFEGSYLTRIGS